MLGAPAGAIYWAPTNGVRSSCILRMALSRLRCLLHILKKMMVQKTPERNKTTRMMTATVPWSERFALRRCRGAMVFCASVEIVKAG